MPATTADVGRGKPRARAIAFYLPQFHPIPENDAWWGKGFTEWTNVVAGRPRFAGHYQPHLPADLGFYDLRVPEVRQAQADMARAHGIEAFCYYHYWFRGKRLLERPLDEMLASGKPDFPFLLCWANESWSRAWSGRENELLIRQEYDAAEARAHIDWLVDVFRDPRYFRVDGRPVFLVYMPEKLPDAPRLLASWRRTGRDRLGVDAAIWAVRTGFSTQDVPGLVALGFDGVVEFEPNRQHFPRARNPTGHAVSLLRKSLPAHLYDAIRDNTWLGRRKLNTIVDYAAYVDARLAEPALDDAAYPGVFPSWDNAARRHAATIIENHDPAQYLRWLQDAIRRVADRPPERRIVFINAWNEWAEGCHLEPDLRHGRQFLEATAAALGAAVPS